MLDGARELWREAAIVLASVVIALAGAWVTLGQAAISRPEVERMLDRQNARTATELARSTEAVASLTLEVNRLAREMAGLRVEVRLLRQRR